MATQDHRAGAASAPPKTLRRFQYASKGFCYPTTQLPRLKIFGISYQTPGESLNNSPAVPATWTAALHHYPHPRNFDEWTTS